MDKWVIAAVVIFGGFFAHSLISSQTQICERTDETFEAGYLSTKAIINDPVPSTEEKAIRSELSREYPLISFVDAGSNYRKDTSVEVYFQGNISSSEAEYLLESEGIPADTIEIYQSWEPPAVKVLEDRYDYVNKWKELNYSVKTDNAGFDTGFIGFNQNSSGKAESWINLLSMRNLYLKTGKKYIELPSNSEITISSYDSHFNIDYRSAYEREFIDRLESMKEDEDSIKLYSGSENLIQSYNSSDMDGDISVEFSSVEDPYYAAAAVKNPLVTEVGYSVKDCK